MATRATYQIDGMTFYCHWDGYPAGAAMRFVKAIAALTFANEGKGIEIYGEARGGLPFAFIRGNQDAEPTGSHADHGDTEWRYTVTSNQDPGKPQFTIKVQARNLNNGLWSTVIDGEDLASWCNEMRESWVHQVNLAKTKRGEQPVPREELLEGWEPLVTAKLDDGYGWKREMIATAANAKALAEAAAKQAMGYQETNPNRAGYQRKAEQWGAAA